METIEYNGLLYETIPGTEGRVCLIESSGLFSSQTKYGSFDSNIQEIVLSIPEYVKHNGISYEVVAIKKSVFDNATSLKEISIPRSVTSIEWGFWNCPNLSKITVDPENPNYRDDEGVLYDKDGFELIAYPNKRGEEYSVLYSTQSIGKFAFKQTDIRKLTLHKSIESINTNAFYRCEKLEEVIVETDRPIDIASMTGDYGQVNPWFVYPSYKVRMNDPVHNGLQGPFTKCKGWIVYDGDNSKYYVLNKQGTGFLDMKFDVFFEERGIFYYGIGESLHDSYRWFDADYWGAMKADGSIMAPAKYKRFETKGRWLLAATDAEIDEEHGNLYYADCTYDLYNMETGELVVCGIFDIVDTKNPNIVLLRMERQRYPYWLAFDIRDFKSVLPMPDGKQYSFNPGDNLLKILDDWKERGWDASLRVKEEFKALMQMFDPSDMPARVYENYSIVRNWTRKTDSLVRHEDGKQSIEYHSVFHVTGDCFYTVGSERGFFGIILNGEEIVPLDKKYFLLTKWDGGYCFGAKETDEKHADVYLLHCETGQVIEIKIMNEIPLAQLSSLLTNGKLEHRTANDGKTIFVQDSGLFQQPDSVVFKSDESMMAKETDHPLRFWRYWYSVHPRLLNPKHFED